MDKKLLIDSYLDGKHPIEQEKWELPSESELDRDEALYDEILAEKKNKTPLLRGRGWGWVSAAAVLIAVVALFTWWNFKPQQPTQLAEKTEKPVEQKDATKVIEKRDVVKTQTSNVTIANVKRDNRKRQTSRLESSQPTIADKVQTASETPVLTNTADSLYYYLTQLENQMGDCRDSTCLAELTGLMRADERIKDLVNKIIHKQVETAYQEEYLVDTTTRYIPL
ncbi:MAG: hypothetical protein J6T78_10085 [Bacteroidaceae bacterium]|nr:hypothetical protein [Bacteroidaceae bacterium]